MSRSLRVVALLVAGCLAFASTGFAAENKNVYFTPGLIYYTGPESRDTGIDGANVGGGLALGLPITERLNIELLGGTADVDYSLPTGSGEDDARLLWVDLMYELGNGEKWKPFLLLGGGRTNIDFGNARDELKDTQLNGGFGLLRMINERVAIRGDFRWVHSRDEGGTEPFAFVGLQTFLGSMTPPPPPDTDGDGVPDPNDRCPNTPPGTPVGPDGCERDSDGDGVVDSADACPNTPAGVAVDSRGCPLDSDGDGVPDYKDACPDTPAGAEVDERGCPPELQETVTIDLNLEFDVDSANLRPEHSGEIRDVIDFMRQFPNTRAVIEGHTDNTGSEAYNQGLSERRARSVRNFIENEGGIAGNRLSSVGYGESRPIDTNDTAEGRQHNRRVSAQVSNK